MTLSIDAAIDLLQQADLLMISAPSEALERLEIVVSRGPAPAVAQALAMMAMVTAAGRTESAMSRAKELLASAAATLQQLAPAADLDRDLAPSSTPHGSSAMPIARYTHASGYLAFRSNDDSTALPSLNRAASLYLAIEGEGSLLRARVFDTLGMLLTRRGDLEGAHGYFSLSVKIKLADPDRTDLAALALTYGNLGRLELLRERFRDAEGWLRKDLKLVLASSHTPATEAHVRNQLALAIQGQGSMRHVDVKAELKRAHEIAPQGSVTAAYVLKNLTTLALDEGKVGDAKKRLAETHKLVEEHRFPELAPWLSFLDARLLLLDAAHASHDRALDLLAEAWTSFVARSMPQEACEVALIRAQALVKIGEPAKAVEVLDEARKLAETHLFRQEQPLARIEAMLKQIGSEGVVAVLQTRFRRMLGGLSEGWFSSSSSTSDSSHGPKRVEVVAWVCEVRGLASCWSTLGPAAVVEHLNRLLGAIGESVLAKQGVVGSLHGDRLVAHFSGKRAISRSFEAGLEAARRLDALKAERAHLDEPDLGISIGICSSWAIEGQIGFVGKIDHALVGPAVSTAFVLVSHAPAGTVALDAVSIAALEADGQQLASMTSASGEIAGVGHVTAFSLLSDPRAFARSR